LLIGGSPKYTEEKGKDEAGIGGNCGNAREHPLERFLK